MFNYRSSKKGVELALASIVTIMLSLVSLYFIIMSLIPFLTSYDNLDIAKQNAQSIVDFVDYFEEDLSYKTSYNCFNILKLHHLEQFQFDDPKKYVYILDEEGVSILVKNEKIDGNTEYKSERVDFIKFKNKNNLFVDNSDTTDLKWLTFGYDDIKFELKKINANNGNKFYLLNPNIPTTLNKVISSFTEDISNNFEVSTTDKEINFYEHLSFLGKLTFPFKEIFSNTEAYKYLDYGVQNLLQRDNLEYLNEGSYLVQSQGFKSDSKSKIKMGEGLFIINSKYTLPLIRNKLCRTMYFNKKTKYSFYNSPDNKRYIDYLNFDVIFQSLKLNEDVYEFKWEAEGVCLKNKEKISCRTLLDLDENNLYSYNDFIDGINYFMDKEKIEGELPIYYLEKTRQDKQKNKKVFIDDVFNGIERINFKEVEDDGIKNKKGILDLSYLNEDKLNGCEESVCNYLILKNNIFYFYNGVYDYIEGESSMSYYSFNELFLRKVYSTIDGDFQINLYYNGEKIKFEKKNFYEQNKGFVDTISGFLSAVGEIWGEGGDGEYYSIIIPNLYDNNYQTHNIEILLTDYQFNNIPELEPYNLEEEIKGEVFGEENNNVILINNKKEEI